MRRENTGTHRNRENTFCLAASAKRLSKRFQSQKPINTLRQFIYTPDTFHLSTGSGEKIRDFPCYFHLWKRGICSQALAHRKTQRLLDDLR